MSRLRTIIVDDEPLAVRLLASILLEIPEVELVDSCRNGREAVRAVQKLEPDLLILDIQMPGMTGFDVVKELQSDLMPMVIFCTAYQRYAVEAFDLYAVDYLLKPINADRVQLALHRARMRLGEKAARNDSKGAMINAIDEIAKRVHEKSGESVSTAPSHTRAQSDRKIAIRDRDNIVMVDVDDIVWVDAAGDYMCVHANGVTHIMRSTLKALVEKLQSDNFKRIHRSTIVNLNHINQVTPLPRGEYILELDCGESLKVSRNYRQAIKAWLDSH